jgi:plasmid maintenance system antidote protein VapI
MRIMETNKEIEQREAASAMALRNQNISQLINDSDNYADDNLSWNIRTKLLDRAAS